MKKKRIEKSDDWDCEDCAVCMAMKIFEKVGRYPSIEELKAVFEKAKDNPKAVVGSEKDLEEVQ